MENLFYEEYFLIIGVLVTILALPFIIWRVSKKQNVEFLPEKQISFWDIVRFFIAFFVTWFVYAKVTTWGYSLQRDSYDALGNLTITIICGIGLPSFLSILVGGMVVSWRYKLVATILLMYPIIAFFMPELFQIPDNFLIYLVYIIKLTFAFLGCVGAIFIWDILSEYIKNKYLKHKTVKSTKIKPKISALLVLLSVFSIPLTFVAIFVSAFVILGLSALLGYILLNLPRVPVFLIIAAILAPLIGIWATLKSLWAILFPKPSFQHAVLVDTTKNCELERAISEVCEKVRTKKPSHVILHAEPTFFVMQGKINTLDGLVKGRILAIGMPLLTELNMGELKSILAHEFAHFSGNDTLYSTVVSPVYRGIASSLENLKVDDSSGGSSLGNATTILMLPSVFFLGLFLKYFATIDMILSRSRELRADLVASTLYGKMVFSHALTKVGVISNHYSENIEKIIYNCNEDLFDCYNKLLGDTKGLLQEYKNKALAEVQTDFDSHPTLSYRLFNLPEEKIKEAEEVSNDGYEILKKELEAKKRDLSKKYTERAKKIKEIYEQYLKAINNLKEKYPLVVSHVDYNSKAEKFGIQKGDMIGKVCDKHVKTREDVIQALKERESTKPVKIEFVRMGKLYFTEIRMKKGESLGIKFET